MTLKNIIVCSRTKLSDSMRQMSKGLPFLMVLNDKGCLIGTVTDGDIRRAVLSGVSLDECIDNVMNSHPTFLKKGASKKSMIEVMRSQVIQHLPIVDDDMQIVDCITLKSFDEANCIITDTEVVLMAGGLGTRLKDITKTTPKVMLPVGGKPILEKIIHSLSEVGFRTFNISLNHMANKVMSYFGNGEKLGIKINYLLEKQKMGTAGSLSLLKNSSSTERYLLSNGDLLTTIDYDALIDFHKQEKADITMCVIEEKISIPYGVVDLEGTKVHSITEKPNKNYYINAGIYVIEKHCVASIPKGKSIDMPDVINTALENKRHVAAFPILEYWKDIGYPEDLMQAREHYENQLLSGGLV